MNPSAWMIHAARWLSVACFAASMPMDFLNGHGPGWLADPDHFQGYEVVAMSLGLQAAGGTFNFEFTMIAAASALVPLAALVNFSKCPSWTVAFPAAIAAWAIWFLASWDGGVFAGFLVWSAAVVLACGTMLLESWSRTGDLTKRRQLVNVGVAVWLLSGIVPCIVGHVIDGEVYQRIPLFAYYFNPAMHWPLILLHLLASIGLTLGLAQWPLSRLRPSGGANNEENATVPSEAS